MTVVIVQCRLSSTRLPGKALKNLGGKTVLEWVLTSMKKVKADAYFLAVDYDSFDELSPIAEKCGWQIFQGPKDDVLERFCMLIQKINADVVVRATADNPFLFYEAAQALLEEFNTCRQHEKVDYITWTNLPHGSGVEIFDAHSLLLAKQNTTAPYDHEHVGPALYAHKEKFNCLFKPAPVCWSFPQLRTTIDTYADYVRAQLIYRHVNSTECTEPDEPFTASQIISAFENPCIKNLILIVPSVKKGRGTGHLFRCLKVAAKIGCVVFIPQNAGLTEKDDLVQNALKNGLELWQITSFLPEPGEYAVIFTDAFRLSKVLASILYRLAPVVALDEGSPYSGYCDYLLNVIPGIEENLCVNASEHKYITLPKNRRSASHLKSADEIKNVLISIGGEDPASLVIPAALAFAEKGKNVTAVKKGITSALALIPQNLRGNLIFMEPINELREELHKYDLVVTHYGLTAYEAAAAGCAVLLLATTELHAELARKYGFACVKNLDLDSYELNSIFNDMEKLYLYKEDEIQKLKSQPLSSFVSKLAESQRFLCPVCHDSSISSQRSASEWKKEKLPDVVVARTKERTFRRCKTCGMLYMSYTLSKDMKYDSNYFDGQYKNQYGKTYIEDFDTIKKQCLRRVGIIESVLHKKKRQGTVLDIGCAYGPFLAAAHEHSWQVFGTDISEAAVSYIRESLNFPACQSAFPDFDSSSEFGIAQFDAVTMWYVIEHFKNLNEVLKKVSSILKTGGIFAFSTPSASGVSARFNKKSFFEQSPSDHFTLWEPQKCQAVLKNFGFKVERLVSTGHHPERFPISAGNGWKKDSFQNKLLASVSHALNLGDTFEVYCRKIREL